MNSGASGGFTRLQYDECAYQKRLLESTTPLSYRLDMNAYENESKCVFNKANFWHPFDTQIVDTESELKGIGRPASDCPQNHYTPTCQKSKMCTSTFDKSVPI